MSDFALNFTLTDFEGSQGDWTTIELSSNLSFFQSLSWQATWHKLAKKYNYQTKILKILLNGKIELISSFGSGKAQVLNIFNQDAIYLNASGKADYDIICTENCQPILSQQHKPQLLSDFLNYLVTDLKTKQIFINAVPVSFIEVLRKACADNALLFIEKKRSSHFWIDFNKLKQNKQNHLQVLTQRTRSQIRKSIDAYKSNFGDLIIRHATSSQIAKEWLECLIDLNISRFDNKNITSSFKFPFLKEFHLELIDAAFTKDEIVMVRVDAGERVVGYIYGFCYKKIIYIYQTGFNFEIDKKFSPGMLSHYLLIEDAIERGLVGYDFLAGDYQYKKSLSNQEDQFIWVQIVKPNFLFAVDQSLRNLKRLLLGFKTSS